MSLDRLYKKYKDKAEFFLVYIREAHPSKGGRTKRKGISVEQPKTLDERATVAKTCTTKLKLPMPCLVDDMKGTTEKAYSAWPTRIVVVDVAGKIAMKGRKGPQGCDVRGAEKALKKVIAEAPKTKPKAAGSAKK